jgi:integrase/recombinase XerD
MSKKGNVIKITMCDADNYVSLNTAFEDFMLDRKSKNLRERSLDNYTKIYNKFFCWMEDNDYSIEDINKELILEYTNYLVDTGISTNSVNSALRHLKAIFNYYMDKDYIPPFKISLLKTDEKIKEVYTDTELKLILKKPNLKKTSFPQYRTWVIINTLAGTGMRINTLINIKNKDVDLNSFIIKVDGENSKNRKNLYIPVDYSLTKILQEYIKIRGGKEDDYLFPSETNSKLVSSSVYHNVEAHNARRGVYKKGLHLFRYTFAKNWIQSGGDIIKLKAILGHSTTAMVEHYARQYGVDVVKGFNNHSVLNKFHKDKLNVKMK